MVFTVATSPQGKTKTYTTKKIQAVRRKINFKSISQSIHNIIVAQNSSIDQTIRMEMINLA
jgi:hypothetical protein